MSEKNGVISSPSRPYSETLTDIAERSGVSEVAVQRVISALRDVVTSEAARRRSVSIPRFLRFTVVRSRSRPVNLGHITKMVPPRLTLKVALHDSYRHQTRVDLTDENTTPINPLQSTGGAPRSTGGVPESVPDLVSDSSTGK